MTPPFLFLLCFSHFPHPIPLYVRLLSRSTYTSTLDALEMRCAQDLFDKKNLAQVQLCLAALSRLVRSYLNKEVQYSKKNAILI